MFVRCEGADDLREDSGPNPDAGSALLQATKLEKPSAIPRFARFFAPLQQGAEDY
jgi:hypothetical protein